MANNHHSTNWPTQRHYLTEALKHLSAFTHNLQTFLELADAADAVHQAELPWQPYVVDTSTTSTVETEPPAETGRRWTMKDVPRKNQPWTSTEEELLVAGRLLGLTHAEIGERIGRSQSSVASHFSNMQLEGRA